jgi:hypothetical protein
MSSQHRNSIILLSLVIILFILNEQSIRVWMRDSLQLFKYSGLSWDSSLILNWQQPLADPRVQPYHIKLYLPAKKSFIYRAIDFDLFFLF